MTDNVMQLPSAQTLPENPLALAARHPSFCSHDAVVLDVHTRTVNCANTKCGAVLDPFNFLVNNAATIERAWSSHREAMRQANEVAERVTLLKKEEQRLRSMVKRLQEKVPVIGRRNREL